jgi:hypothetical protein
MKMVRYPEPISILKMDHQETHAPFTGSALAAHSQS